MVPTYEIVSFHIVFLTTCMICWIQDFVLLHFMGPGIVPAVVAGCCSCADPGVNSQAGEIVAE